MYSITATPAHPAGTLVTTSARHVAITLGLRGPLADLAADPYPGSVTALDDAALALATTHDRASLDAVRTTAARHGHHDAAARITAALAPHTVRPGDLVSTPEHLIALVSATFAGAYYVTVDYAGPWPRPARTPLLAASAHVLDEDDLDVAALRCDPERLAHLASVANMHGHRATAARLADLTPSTVGAYA